MKKEPFVIILITAYAVFFQLAILTGMNEKVIIFMFFLSPFLVMYLAYIILKYGKPCNDSFDEKFYQDQGYPRNGEEELTTG